jgi:F420-dependent oxidoreductase-like protein
MIGVTLQAQNVSEGLTAIKRAEAAGVDSVWLTSGGGGGDSLTVLALAARETEKIKLGTAIVPTWPRHPIVIAQQTHVIAQLAPGRFRLGIGSSHQAGMERSYGVRWRRPLSQVREYVIVLRLLLGEGSVDFEGRFVTARAQMPPVDVPVMISALREGSFKLAGELADGAISWVCPWPYLRDKALPAMKAAAVAAGRPTPPLIAHVPVCVETNPEEARAAARDQIGRYGQIPFYAAMFADAGFPDTAEGVSDALIDNLVVYGSEVTVGEKLNRILAEGAGEIIAHPILTGDDRARSLDRTLEAVAAAAGA